MLEISYNLASSDRCTQRSQLVNLFLAENPGTGTGDNSSKYQYNVETFNDYSIFLKRPAHLNKGFDFTVHVTNIKLTRGSCPSHNDIIFFLTNCKNSHPQNYQNVIDAINAIYNCHDCDLDALNNIYFCDYINSQHPIQVILLVIKWLFMEQDITYWNFSGRAMLFNALQDNLLV